MVADHARTISRPGGCSGDDSERQLLVQAGAELAACGANHQALEYFGLQWIHRNEWRGCLAKIESLGLPVHTVPTDSRVHENDHLISCIFGRSAECPPKRLILAFDRTYLAACSQLATTTLGHVMLGGAHRPAGFDLEDESQAVLKTPEGKVNKIVLKKGRTLANEMEACVLWDPTRKSSPTFELAAYPCCSAACRDERFENAAVDPRKRGNWEVLCRLGALLSNSGSVKFVMADAHGSHQYLASWMLGLEVPLADDLKRLVPYFRDLKFEDLPLTCFPISARVAYSDGQPVHWIGGPAHSQKNFVKQLRSCIGTAHFGTQWCDQSAALELGLFPTAYAGTDTMSDKQSALWYLGVSKSFGFLCSIW